MEGTSPSRIKLSFLPNHNDDPDTMPVVDVVFIDVYNKPWGSDEPVKHYDIKMQGTVVFYVVTAAYILIHH